MNKDKISDVIIKIFNNNISKGINIKFRRWIISNDNKEIKTDILHGIWNDLAPKINIQATSDGLNRLHRQIQSKSTLNFYLRKVVAMFAIGIFTFSIGYLTSDLANNTNQEIHLVTSHRSKGEFILPDQTKVWLNSHSTLIYNKKDYRNVKLIGEAYFEVTKNLEEPFCVEMDQTTVKVLGTKFNACNYPHLQNEEVVLTEGSVEIICDILNKDFILKPNDQFTFNKRNKTTHVIPVESHHYTTWFNDHLTFDNTELKNIFKQIEKWYNVEIISSSRINLERRLSLKIYNENLDQTMSVLSLIGNFKYKNNHNKILIL